MKVPAGGTCSLARGSRAAATLQVVATGAHTADTGHGLLREARLGRDHHHADVEHDAFAESGAHRQSTRSWFVVEYVTSTLNHIGTMPAPTSAVLGTAWDAAGERR